MTQRLKRGRYHARLITAILMQDRPTLERHIAAAEREAAAYQDQNPWLATVRRRDAEVLRAYHRGASLDVRIS